MIQTNKWKIAGLALTALLTGPAILSCAPPDSPPPEGSYKATQGPHAVRQEYYTWRDIVRRRDIPTHIYLPGNEVGPLPTIVYSHGLGGTCDQGTYLSEHLASYGYMVVCPNHPGTDFDAIFGTIGLVRNLMEFHNDLSWRRDRALDISFVLDQVEKHASLGPLVDPERIGIAGYSLGAYTAQITIGLRIDLPGNPGAQFVDPRIKAAVTMTPPGLGSFDLTENDWNAIDQPCLSMIGTRDWDIVTLVPKTRRAAYENSPGPNQYLLTIEDATHGAFDEDSVVPSHYFSYVNNNNYVLMVSTAFFDAYLNREEAAQTWLLSGTIEELSDGVCTLEYKHITPINDEL